MVRRRSDSDDPPPPVPIPIAVAGTSSGDATSDDTTFGRSCSSSSYRRRDGGSVSFSDNVEIHIIPCWNEYEIRQLYYNENDITRFQYEANYDESMINDYIFPNSK